MDAEEDKDIIDWFYDDKPLQHTKHVNGPTYRKWKLPLPVMSTLYRLAGACSSQSFNPAPVPQHMLCCFCMLSALLFRAKLKFLMI